MTTIETPQQPVPGQPTERIEEFKREIADMRLRDPATSRDRMLLRGGVALMVIGVGFTIAGYFGSHNTTNPLSQRDFIITALIGISLTIVGAAVFVRYSVAQFLRFWLARLSYEQQRQTDRIIDSLDR